MLCIVNELNKEFIYCITKDYQFAVQVGFNIVIPLSDTIKKFEEKELKKYTDLIFAQLGFTELPSDASEHEKTVVNDFTMTNKQIELFDEEWS
jgi:hypothetical protein